jgi:hypothetical protein
MRESHDWLPRNHEALYDQSTQIWNFIQMKDAGMERCRRLF